MTDEAQRKRRRSIPVTLSLALLAAVAVPVVLLHGATAQTRGRPKPKPAPAAPAAATPAGGAPPQAGVPGATGSTGAVPRPDMGDAGARISPLNPTAEEMPVTGPAGSVTPVAAVDYDRLLGDIAALRARVADVADALFVSRIVLSVQTDGDHAKIGHLTVSLDDGIAYTAPESFKAEDPITVYDHAVAPGHHAVTVEVDRQDDRDDTFRDTQKTRFIVDVPKDSRLAVTLRVGDDSDMGGKFPGEHHGKYDLRVRMKAAVSAVKR